MEACGCGEEGIPWMLAKFGLLGAGGLILATLLLMLAAGWLLSTAVWAALRLVRRRTPVQEAPVRQASLRRAPGHGSALDDFTWRDDPA
jgi:hypothetical protein